MTSVSGSTFGSKTMVYNDDNCMTSITYGGVTDLYYYTYEGLCYRARLNETYYRYLYDGERVLEELNDSGTMTARYTTENGSYYGQWLHLYRPSGSLSQFPMYDNIGTARGLLDASGTATDWYELDTFGRQVSSSGATPNPYRYGGEWGYITDPSGMLQLGERFYYPELGRFVSQDPIRDGVNWYAYADGNPLLGTDPQGLKTAKECKADYVKAMNRCEEDKKCRRAEGGILGCIGGVITTAPSIVGTPAGCLHGMLIGMALAEVSNRYLAGPLCERRAGEDFDDCLRGRDPK